MAYTYEDFVNAATREGLLDKFSQEDLTTAQKSPEFGMSILNYKKDYRNATTAEQKILANEAANQLRKSYGSYDGGADGSAYQYDSRYRDQVEALRNQTGNYGSFQYGGQEAYQKLLQEVANREPFQYDLDKDPVRAAYQKQYRREGERASADTLAQASAATGGRPSSWAQTAAQQAANYYAGQLSDKVPELEQDAYQRYLNDYSAKLSGLSTLQTDRNFDYNAWVDEYNWLQSQLSVAQGMEESEYQRYLDRYNMAYQQKADQAAQDQQKWQNALSLYSTLGYATPELAKLLGIPEGYAGGSAYGYGSGAGSERAGTTASQAEGGGISLTKEAAGIAGSAYNGLISQINNGIQTRENAGVDQHSLAGLGYGNMTPEELEQRIAAGEVEEYFDDGVWKYRRTYKPKAPVLTDYLKGV